MNRGVVIRLSAFALAAFAVALAAALFIPWLPEQASRERGRIDFIFWLTTGISVFIFAVVAGVLLYSVVAFRARPDDDSDGAPIHGHTGLEIAWTAVPAILVTVITVASAIVLAKNGRASSDALNVDVTAQQFVWSFKYPDEHNLTSTVLRLPLGRSVVLHLQAKDVIHSFFVPEFGQKQDAVPGIETTLVITPTKLGTFPVECTELCGLGHAFMRSSAIVMKPAAFRAWTTRGGKALAGPAAQAGKTVYANNGCSSCHTFSPAGSSAKIGPNLDTLSAEAKRAGKPVDDFVRESIVKPNAYVEHGYPANVMPQTFGQLPSAQLDALVQYLVQGGKGKH